MTLEEALHGKEIPQEIRDALTLVTVPYFSFAEMKGEGQLVVHKDLLQDVESIFAKLFARQFPIQKMVPVVAYGWDDILSMQDNNTSSFNYRTIYGTNKISNHALGRAIDINPLINPHIQMSGEPLPPSAYYDPTRKGAVTPEIAEVFLSHTGWGWGGNYRDEKDWQHFQKPEVK